MVGTPDSTRRLQKPHCYSPNLSLTSRTPPLPSHNIPQYLQKHEKILKLDSEIKVPSKLTSKLYCIDKPSCLQRPPSTNSKTSKSNHDIQLSLLYIQSLSACHSPRSVQGFKNFVIKKRFLYPPPPLPLFHHHLPQRWKASLKNTTEYLLMRISDN